LSTATSGESSSGGLLRPPVATAPPRPPGMGQAIHRHQATASVGAASISGRPRRGDGVRPRHREQLDMAGSLTRTSTGAPLWASRYSRGRRNLPAVEGGSRQPERVFADRGSRRGKTLAMTYTTVAYNPATAAQLWLRRDNRAPQRREKKKRSSAWRSARTGDGQCSSQGTAPGLNPRGTSPSDYATIRLPRLTARPEVLVSIWSGRSIGRWIGGSSERRGALLAIPAAGAIPGDSSWNCGTDLPGADGQSPRALRRAGDGDTQWR